MSPRVWVTRTQPEADATAVRLRALGFEPVVAPVLRAQALKDVVIDVEGVDALAFTSGHAVRAFAGLSRARGVPVFTVGDRTAAIARYSGFAEVHSAAGDVVVLADEIAWARPRQVLHSRARDTAGDLEGLLEARGVKARGVVVYETVPTSEASAPPDLAALLIHSPKAARIAAGLIDSARAGRTVAIAISASAAAPLEGAGFARVAASPFPNEAALLDLLQELLSP